MASRLISDETSGPRAPPTEPPPPTDVGTVVSVLVELPQHSGVGPLSYCSDLPLAPGTLVQVPLGRRVVPGVVAPDVPEAPDAPDAEVSALKAVAATFTALPPLDAEWLGFVRFAAGYYQRPWGELVLTALPPELRKTTPERLERRLRRLAGAEPRRSDLSVDASGPEGAPLMQTTAEQTAVLAAAAAHWAAASSAGTAPAPVLLFGATGSGKTEVYLRAAQAELARGRQVLVLVPEINLTPQLERRLKDRLGHHGLVTLHSGLTPAQRLNHWLMAHLGTAGVVLGTRLAVMASLPRLGLIVVDEEHDPSYKQQEGARYSARDLAISRAHRLKIPVLLGSATPSLESWRHAHDGRYLRLDMPTRVGQGALPTVRVVDMNTQPKGTAAGLAPALVSAVQERIDRGEQSLLLLNRRGYAPVLHCTACAWKSACPHCAAWQVFHKSDRSLRCHHCGAHHRVPRACPECGNLDISAVGRGTERLEELLPTLLQGREGAPLRVLRIDADSTRGAGQLEAHLEQVHRGAVDVLIGTQMVAKGHDFRKVTLVAAINPDGALFSSDFRAPERLLALLLQAAGRAGRDAEQAARSEMWIQTWHPEHPVVQALRRHDYAGYAALALEERAQVGLPPFSHLALLRAEGRELAGVSAFLSAAEEAAQAWMQAQSVDPLQVTIYPPVPAVVARVADQERMQILLESTSRPVLQALLRAWVPRLLDLRSEHRGISRWALDVDPSAL